jgi:glycosyltransferase involved in cell wall biosynthesis
LKIAGETAVVYDWLVVRAGAERILEAVLSLLPGAPVFTQVYDPRAFRGSEISRHPIHTSLIQRLPFARRRYRSYLPLMPFAIEQFDLRPYRTILSISFATAHGALARPDQRHIAYICSPARYAWHLYQDYLETGGLRRGVRSWLARGVLHYLRTWDFAAAQRVDRYFAISQWVANCVQRAYRREAAVLYPPVEVERFDPLRPRGEYFITVSRLVAYKRVDLIVQAFNRLGYPLLVVGDGPEAPRLARMASPNIRFTGYVTDAEAADLLGGARGFVYMAEEDFGLALVEAQAAGCPVIAYRRGGAVETVCDGTTGLFFERQSPEALIEAVERFRQREPFDPRLLRRHAEEFSRPRFEAGLRTLVGEDR